MAAPAVIPIIKKVVSALVSSKKGRKFLLTVLGIVLVIILLPMIAILGIFSTISELDTQEIESMVKEKQEEGEATLKQIETKMIENGFSNQKVEEAQALYLIALFDKSEEKNFVSRLVGCFKSNQSDSELISAVNEEFDTSLKTSDYTETIKDIRKKYK